MVNVLSSDVTAPTINDVLSDEYIIWSFGMEGLLASSSCIEFLVNSCQFLVWFMSFTFFFFWNFGYSRVQWLPFVHTIWLLYVMLLSIIFWDWVDDGLQGGVLRMSVLLTFLDFICKPLTNPLHTHSKLFRFLVNIRLNGLLFPLCWWDPVWMVWWWESELTLDEKLDIICSTQLWEYLLGWYKR